MAGDPRSVMVFAAPADPQRREQLDALAFDGAAAARRDVLVVDVAERLDALALCDLYRVTARRLHRRPDRARRRPSSSAGTSR